MEIEEVQWSLYKQIIKAKYIFNIAEFNELNKAKVDELIYLLFKEKKYRFGICIGRRNNDYLCPFSAPFGVLEPVKLPVSVGYYDDAIKAMNEYLLQKSAQSMQFVLPPMFYDQTGISCIVNTLYRNGYEYKNTDINFQMDLKKLCVESYTELIPYHGKKNLRISFESGLSFKRCESEDEIKIAYAVIAENRESRGFPLRMSLQQVLDTIQIVEHELFLVMKEEEPIASALVYHINSDVAQVIYWGDKPGFGEFKPINFISYNLMHYYFDKGFKYLDIGPSSENSIPNIGLCDFKLSIGCDISSKFTMTNFFQGDVN